MASVSAIRDVARVEDVEGLHLALCRLRNELAEHIALESDAIEGMPGAVAEPVRQGQRRVLRFVDDMLTESSDDAGCACMVRAAELRGLLVRQIRLESSLGTHHHHESGRDRFTV
jgi:hypothetical protein